MQVHALTYNIRGLPWSNTRLEQILAWTLAQEFPIVCFQEVFTVKGRDLLKKRLQAHGYNVIIPHDEGVSLFPSGLVTAVHPTHYTVLHTTFRPFLAYHNVEIFANKGFQRITLRDKNTHCIFHLLNTHTQSDEEVFMWTRYSYKKSIRYKQAEQMIEDCRDFREPVLVMGDFNQESSLHPYLRTLHPPSSLPLKKATFFSTCEDLDHVAWMPLQGTKGIQEGCGFCGTFGPVLEFCKVHDVTWSDHAPVELKVRLPQ